MSKKSGSGEKLHDKLITNEKIKKGKRIGDGQFGEVYKGNFDVLSCCCICIFYIEYLIYEQEM